MTSHAEQCALLVFFRIISFFSRLKCWQHSIRSVHVNCQVTEMKVVYLVFNVVYFAARVKRVASSYSYAGCPSVFEQISNILLID